MRLKGFTLAEVLITVTILGVIAILAAPALISNIQKQQAGPAVLRAISTLDTANSLVFNEQEMFNFSEFCYSEGDGGYVDKCFAPFVAGKMNAALDDQTTIDYRPIDGDESRNITLTNGYVTQNGFVYYFITDDETENGIDVAIDINGSKAPNIIGKDLFYAYINYDQDGKVLARGSRVDTQHPGEWVDNCNQDTAGDGSMCAGSIIDNGGKVIYPW